MHPLITILVGPLLAAPGLAGASPTLDPLEEGPGEAQVSASTQAEASTQLEGPAPADLSATVRATSSEVFLQASLPDAMDDRAPPAEASGDAAVQDDEETAGAGASPVQPVELPEPSEAAMAAGVATAGLAAYAALRWRYLLGLVPMYSRLSKADLLDNEVRAELVELVEENPGLSQGELCEAVDAGWGNTTYHLQRLEQAGFLRSEKQGHHRRFYRAGEVESEQIEALGVLKNENANKIARYLVEEPGCNQKQVCEALDISPSLAHKWISRLEDNDLVTSEREWRSKHYEPCEQLPELVEAV